jgi:hypothetical protein
LKFFGIPKNIRLGTKFLELYRESLLQSWLHNLKLNQFGPMVLVGLGFLTPSLERKFVEINNGNVTKRKLAKVSDGNNKPFFQAISHVNNSSL